MLRSYDVSIKFLTTQNNYYATIFVFARHIYYWRKYNFKLYYINYFVLSNFQILVFINLDWFDSVVLGISFISESIS